VKKKSPPYAIIVAVVLAIAGIAIYLQIEKSQQAAADKRVADQAAADKAALDAANNHSTTSVTPVDTDVRPVLYATQPVEAGIRISPAFYEKKQTPKDIMPDAYTGDSDIVGWYAIRKIEKGDPLTPRNIGKSIPYMSTRIKPGMRLITLPMFNGDDNNTGGFIVDGDRVDIYYTALTPDGSLIRTQLLVQNVDVLSVPGPQVRTEQSDGITPAPPPEGKLGVTFQVAPETAEALIYLSQAKLGHFSMVLRARKDDTIIKVKSFEATDYNNNFARVQRIAEKGDTRVNELSAEIEAKEKAQQGTTNEITTPTPPTP
jgi:Flp pilus assembly protein CpaB